MNTKSFQILNESVPTFFIGASGRGGAQENDAERCVVRRRRCEERHCKLSIEYEPIEPITHFCGSSHHTRNVQI
jgi:hypothetical protein